MRSWSEVARAHAAMILHAVLISTSFPIAIFLADRFPPLQTTLWRFTLAALLFSLILVASRRWQWPEPIKLVRYAIVSLPLAGFFLLMFIAGRHTSAFNLATLSTLIPLFTALLAWNLWRQPIGNLRIVALLLGLIGALWVLFRGEWPTLMDWDDGMSLFLCGCLLLALYPLVLKQWGRNGSVAQTTTWILITGSLWLLLAQLVFGENWYWPDRDSFNAILWLAIVTTMATFFLFQFANLYIGGDSAHAYGYLNPILVVLINGLLGIPWPESRIWLGMGMVGMALLIILVQDKKKAPQ